MPPVARSKRSKNALATVIVNPASAGGATGKRWPAVELLFEANKFAHDVVFTSRPGHATALTRQALRDGAASVIAVGGDGTLNEVVNGFFDEEGVAINASATLGILPSGTGGDFRKSIGMDTSPDKAVAQLVRGRTVPVDVGRVDYDAGERRFFINITDCGIGGEVVARVNRSRYKGGGIRGTGVFLWTSLSTLMTYPGCDATVTIDGKKITGNFRNIVIANGRYFGGGMKIAPDARIDDGLFDVVLIRGGSRVSALTGVPAIYRGTHLSRDDVDHHRGAVVRVTTSGSVPLLFDVEGEQVGAAPATVTCLPGAIRVVAPKVV
jgi:YegS/Rv2252/BmrU family lipid kinase